MSNIIQFILQLKDMMSGSMRSAATNAQNAMRNVERASNNASRAVGSVGASATRAGNNGFRSISVLERALRRLEYRRSVAVSLEGVQTANRQIAQLQQDLKQLRGSGVPSAPPAGGRGGSMFGSMLGANFVTAIGSKMIAAAQQAGQYIISATAKKEQDLIGLQTFLGKKGAAEAYANIQQDAARTPFDTAGLLSVNRALISSGLSAQAARQDTLNLANAISATGGGNDELQRMAQNMQQIKTVGVATAQDIKQFGYAGINIYKLLADATGESIDKVKEMDVSYELLSYALEKSAQKGGIYFGAMEAQSKSLSGKWSTFSDNIGQGAVKIGDAFQPFLSKVLDIGVQLANGIGPALERIKPIIDGINNALIAAVDWVTNIGSSTGNWSYYIQEYGGYLQTIWGVVKHVSGVVWDILSGIIQWVGKSQIMKDLFTAIETIMTGVWSVVCWIADKIKELWDNVVSPMLNGLDNAYRWLTDRPSMAEEEAQQKSDAAKNAALKASEQKTLENQRKIADSVFAGIEKQYQEKQYQKLHPNPTSSFGGGKGKGGRASGLSSGITSGGPKSIVVNWTAPAVGTFNLTTMNVKEGVGGMEALVEDAMKRLFYSLQTANG